MTRWLLLLALAAFCVAPQAHAQDQATIVATCGSKTFQAGTTAFRTIDVNGVLCTAGGGSAPPPTSVWSAADAAANGMTLSNGGLTVTAPSGIGFHTIRGTVSKSSGKVYIEFKAVAGGINGDGSEGVADAGFISANTYLGTSNYSAGVFYAINYVSAGFTSNYPTVQYATPTHVVGMAIDFAAGSLWVALDNVWTTGSNPATGSLPIISFVPATVGALYPAITTQDSVEVWTLQPTAASQTYAPPAGFSPWDP